MSDDEIAADVAEWALRSMEATDFRHAAHMIEDLPEEALAAEITRRMAEPGVARTLTRAVRGTRSLGSTPRRAKTWSPRTA